MLRKFRGSLAWPSRRDVTDLSPPSTRTGDPGTISKVNTAAAQSKRACGDPGAFGLPSMGERQVRLNRTRANLDFSTS
jgi:hypothetical protein